MYTFLLVIHVIVCISLIVSVLMQSSKGGGLGGAFGGAGGSDTLFGTEGASKFLKKVTQVLGVSFMVITILLAVTSGPQNVTTRESGVSEEVQKEIDKKGQTQQPEESALPEGFEQLPEPEGQTSE
ncbi:MAG: preprotein translocase subunit SecG [Candidatus Cloacimonetes bacterium]|nr:preprotein translocase subunit SecG [Candidatus Cloacimonadota bacterium]MBS3767321.1 preprotein translocase subunit SecG [Candidatus Cloacimonadota bacterium]